MRIRTGPSFSSCSVVIVPSRSEETSQTIRADKSTGQPAARIIANLAPADLPTTESLKDTLARVEPYWHARIAPELAAGSNVLVVAHGNSLRALVKMLDGMSDADIVEFNIPTGIPLLYDLDDKLAARGRRFLGDPERAAAAAEAVRRQTESARH